MKSVFLKLCFIFLLFAKDNIQAQNSYGLVSYGKESIDEINHNGNIKLDGTQVRHLQVNGLLEARYAQIEEMQVNGNTILDNCSIKQKSSIYGYLQANNSNFFDELSVASEEIVLNSCSLKSVRMLKTSNYPREQVVKLTGKTKITGSIIFDDKNGKVIVGPNCEIGEVIGGKIVK